MPMKAQSGNRSVSRTRIELLETCADGERQRYGQHKGGAGLKVPARTISRSAEGRTRSGRERRQRRAIVLLVESVKFEANPDALAFAKRQTLVLGPESGGALHQRFAVAEYAEGQG